MTALLLTYVLALPIGLVPRTSQATVFSVASEDKHNKTDTLACTRPYRRLKTTENAIASYNLPCKAKVVLYLPRTGKTVIARVLDRGPRRAKKKAKRFDLDLSKNLASELGHNGHEKVVWFILSKPVL